MANQHQRVENLIAVPAPSCLDEHALATKFRLFTEDGEPIDIASFEARLRALEGPPLEVEPVEESGEEYIEESGSSDAAV